MTEEELTQCVEKPQGLIKIECLNELAFRKILEDTTESESLAKQAIELSNLYSLPLEKAKGLNVLGILAKNKGKIKIAESYYTEVLKIRQEEGEWMGVVRCYNNLGNLYKTTEGDYEKARGYYLKGLELLKEALESKEAAQLYNNLGSLLTRMGEYIAAKINLETGLVIRKTILLDTSGVANSLLNLGVLFQEKGEYERSDSVLTESLAFFKSLKNNNRQGKCYILLGNNHFHENNYERALSNYEKAFAFFSELSDNDQAILLRNQGSVYFQMGLREKALKSFQHSRSIFEKTQNAREIAAIDFDLGNIYFAQADYGNAIILYEKSLEQLDSIPDIKLKNAILTNRHLAAQVRNSRLIRGALVALIFLLFLLIISVLIAIRQRQKKIIAGQKVDQLLYEQELAINWTRQEAQGAERNRIARDLHDRLGSMLSVVKLKFDKVEDKIENLAYENRKQYENALQMLDEACNEVRVISHNLESGVLKKFGLKTELEDLAETLRECTNLEVELDTHGLQSNLDKYLERNINNIVRELVKNAVKHAQASKINIQVNRFDLAIHIAIEDNGVGFLPELARKKDGMGLRNVEARTAHMGGALHIDSKKGRGTTVIIKIPIIDKL